jgi:hypothetical protein
MVQGALQRYLMRIMYEVSYLNPHTEEINTLSLDDPDPLKYPIAYSSEVDYGMTHLELFRLPCST